MSEMRKKLLNMEPHFIKRGMKQVVLGNTTIGRNIKALYFGAME